MFSDTRITCAYLFVISRYGYPPPVTATVRHIREMAAAGFTSMELEGIGRDNIRYLFENRQQVAETLDACGAEVPVFCTVLPGMGAVAGRERLENLEFFEMGCETAQFFGAAGVLDNGPLLPLRYPAGQPVKRHYNGEALAALLPPPGFEWPVYWQELTETFREACRIAAGYGLDYHLHPCEGSLTATTDAFLLFADAVNAPNLKFNLDTANQFLVHDNLPLSLMRLADRTNYIHISDNTGTRVAHLPPGEGNIRWDTFFATLRDTGFRGRLAIDVGGEENGAADPEDAYRRTAAWLEQQLEQYEIAT